MKSLLIPLLIAASGLTDGIAIKKRDNLESTVIITSEVTVYSCGPEVTNCPYDDTPSQTTHWLGLITPVPEPHHGPHFGPNPNFGGGDGHGNGYGDDEPCDDEPVITAPYCGDGREFPSSKHPNRQSLTVIEACPPDSLPTITAPACGDGRMFMRIVKREVV